MAVPLRGGGGKDKVSSFSTKLEGRGGGLSGRATKKKSFFCGFPYRAMVQTYQSFGLIAPRVMVGAMQLHSCTRIQLKICLNFGI